MAQQKKLKERQAKTQPEAEHRFTPSTEDILNEKVEEYLRGVAILKYKFRRPVVALVWVNDAVCSIRIDGVMPRNLVQRFRQELADLDGGLTKRGAGKTLPSQKVQLRLSVEKGSKKVADGFAPVQIVVWFETRRR